MLGGVSDVMVLAAHGSEGRDITCRFQPVGSEKTIPSSWDRGPLLVSFQPCSSLLLCGIGRRQKDRTGSIAQSTARIFTLIQASESWAVPNFSSMLGSLITSCCSTGCGMHTLSLYYSLWGCNGSQNRAASSWKPLYKQAILLSEGSARSLTGPQRTPGRSDGSGGSSKLFHSKALSLPLFLKLSSSHFWELLRSIAW